MTNNTTSLCTARTNALYCSIHELVVELEERIEDGEALDNSKLIRTADRIFGNAKTDGRYTLRDAYDALEIAVNNYLFETHARQLMQMDVCEALVSVLRPLLQRLPRQHNRTFELTDAEQCCTPPTLAYFVARLLNPKPDSIVLEPSSGTGSLAIWPRVVGARVIWNETSPRRNSLLRCVFNLDVFPLDAEVIDDLLPREIRPTGVLMNPPSSDTNGGVTKTNSNSEVRHVGSALRRLQDGGRLVAIASEAMSLQNPGLADWWQRIACLCDIRANLTLNGTEYSSLRAAPDVQILIIDKIGSTPGVSWHERSSRICSGYAPTIEEAWEILRHLVAIPESGHVVRNSRAHPCGVYGVNYSRR